MAEPQKPNGITLQSQYTFTKTSSPTDKVARANKFCFLLKDNNGETDYQEEAAGLLMYLMVIFPKETLDQLRDKLTGQGILEQLNKLTEKDKS